MHNWEKNSRVVLTWRLVINRFGKSFLQQAVFKTICILSICWLSRAHLSARRSTNQFLSLNSSRWGGPDHIPSLKIWGTIVCHSPKTVFCMIALSHSKQQLGLEKRRKKALFFVIHDKTRPFIVRSDSLCSPKECKCRFLSSSSSFSTSFSLSFYPIAPSRLDVPSWRRWYVVDPRWGRFVT